MRGVTFIFCTCIIAVIFCFQSPVSAEEIGQVSLPDSFVMANIDKSVIHPGEPLPIDISVGCAKDHCTPPDSIAVWVFSHNFVYHDIVPFTDWSVTYVLPPEITSNMEMGEYFILIQHPGSGSVYDVTYTKDFPSSGQTSIRSQVNSEYVIVDGQGKTEPALAAQRLIEMHYPACDDTYYKIKFFVEQIPQDTPGVTFDPLGDYIQGEPLIVSGTTDEPAGSTLLVELESTAFQTGRTDTNYNSKTVTVLESKPSNLWYAVFDTTDYVPDQYLITTKGPKSGAFNYEFFNILKGKAPPTFTLSLNRTEVNAGDVIEVVLTTSTTTGTPWYVLDPSLAPDGFDVRILSDTTYDSENNAWITSGNLLKYQITAPAQNCKYLLIPRVFHREQAVPYSDGFNGVAVEEISVGTISSTPNRLSSPITYILSPVLPPAACPFCSLLAGVGIALLGTMLSAGTGTSFTGLFTWLMKRMDKILDFIKKAIGFRTIGLLGTKETKLRNILPAEDSPLLFGFSAREWTAIAASVTLFGLAFLIAGRLNIDLLSIISFLFVGACAVIAHELVTQWMTRHYQGSAEFQIWGLGTVILLFNSSLFGVTLGKPSRTITADLERLTPNQISTIMLSGPTVNVLFAIASLSLIPLGGIFTLAGSIGAPLNIMLAMYALIPVYPMKGRIVYNLNKKIWILAFLPVLILFLVVCLMP